MNDSKTTDRRRGALKMLLPVAQGIGVVAIVATALSGPAYAFGDSAVLAPILMQIEQAIMNTLTGTLKSGFERSASSIIQSQVKTYTNEMLYKAMPGTFCSSDSIATLQMAGAARASGYNGAVATFATTGAGSIAAPVAGGTNQPTFLPNHVIAAHNARVRAMNVSATCKPYQPAPVDVTGTDITCTPDERRMVAEVLLGALPPEQMPASIAGTAPGEVYESARTTVIARKQLAALALNDASSDDRQRFITAYRTVLQKPSIDDLAKLSATGGAERDSIVLQQLTAQLILELYVETVEQKRLLAVLLAQGTETQERDYLSVVRRRAAE